MNAKDKKAFEMQCVTTLRDADYLLSALLKSLSQIGHQICLDFECYATGVLVFICYLTISELHSTCVSIPVSMKRLHLEREAVAFCLSKSLM